MILDNRTPFQAERFVSIDRDAAEHLVVAVKATYDVGVDGATRRAAEQMPVVLADDYYGEPGLSSIRYESDCVPGKVRVDVVVVGHAYAPHGRDVEQLNVELWVGGAGKKVRVIGDRVWQGVSATASKPSAPAPFAKMPLTYERAFGGTDTSPEDPAAHQTDMRNPIGRGFLANAEGVIGAQLPNMEDPQALISSWRSRPSPVGFGCVARGSSSRIQYAGTYDQHWLNERFPFLPDDFDTRYFQCAPDDQQFAEISGGEVIRCLGMTPDGDWHFRVPHESFPIHVLRRQGQDTLRPRLGTIVVEPDARRCSLVWHAAVPVGGKLHDILSVVVGDLTSGERRARETGKHYFSSLSELIEWQEELRAEAES